MKVFIKKYRDSYPDWAVILTDDKHDYGVLLSNGSYAAMRNSLMLLKHDILRVPIYYDGLFDMKNIFKWKKH